MLQKYQFVLFLRHEVGKGNFWVYMEDLLPNCGDVEHCIALSVF